MAKVINPEVVNEVANDSAASTTFLSNPYVKWGGLTVTGLIGGYGLYRLGKLVYGKVKARRAAKATKVEEPADPEPAPASENPNA